MGLKNTSKQRRVGVIGAGSFGTAVATLLSENSPVLLYARKVEFVEGLLSTRRYKDFDIPENITPTTNLEEVAQSCNVLFPVVPSTNFRRMMKDLAPLLRPSHILIHATKGLDTSLPEGQTLDSVKTLTRANIKTMSEVILEESDIIRVGCLAGPNLASEILRRQPAATVVASHFEEVIQIGEDLLRSDRFQVYGNNDLIGIELAGVLKNIIAIAAGALSGLGMGENARALLISRGMVEMIYLGRALGGDTATFTGLAGVGDLVATCTSALSRNFTVGCKLAEGKTLEQVLSEMDEVAEGINTVRLLTKIIHGQNLSAPITETLYKVLFEDLKAETALKILMRYPFVNEDVAYL